MDWRAAPDSLLYISGSGRSGSTLVERLLHASSRFVALGEFHVLWRLPHDQITCACGRRLPDDPFWQAVLAAADITPAVIGDLARLEARVARSGRVASAGFRLAALATDPDVAAFLAPQQAIFAAVRQLSGRPVVVDSSKAGPRAWLLAAADAHVLHLWRHPTDVIASWRSKKFDRGLGTLMARPGIGTAAMEWWKVEQLVRRLAAEHAVVMLDYGRLCRDPAHELAAALAVAGLTGDSGIPWQDGHRVIAGDDYHSLNGNPDRFERGTITVSARRIDWSHHGAADRTMVPIAGAVLASLYRAPAATSRAESPADPS